MNITQVVKVTNGNVGVVHTSHDGTRTLCGRDAAGMLNLSKMGPWERMGWDASAKGACLRCEKAAAKIAAATPSTMPEETEAELMTAIESFIPAVIDSTPAGIFAAMMRANANEDTAPQSRLYGLLSDYLRRTLTALYGIDGDSIYASIMSSGEASDDVITDTLADRNYARKASAMNISHLVQCITGDCNSAPAPLFRVLFSQEEALARTMLALVQVARFRDWTIDLTDIPEFIADDIRDGVFGSRRVRLTSMLDDHALR